jgi:hypothetical protein
MKAFKFVIPPRQFVPHPSGDGRAYAGCIAVVVAENEMEARVRLKQRAQEDGEDADWLDCIDHPQAIELVPGVRLAWVMI